MVVVVFVVVVWREGERGLRGEGDLCICTYTHIYFTRMHAYRSGLRQAAPAAAGVEEDGGGNEGAAGCWWC